MARILETHKTDLMVLHAVKRLRHGGTVSQVQAELCRVENRTLSWEMTQSHLNHLWAVGAIDCKNGIFLQKNSRNSTSS